MAFQGAAASWVIQLINEELPGYFKSTYLDENTADGQINNKAIHSRKQGSNMNRIKTSVALLLLLCVFYHCLQWQQKRSREK